MENHKHLRAFTKRVEHTEEERWGKFRFVKEKAVMRSWAPEIPDFGTFYRSLTQDPPTLERDVTLPGLKIILTKQVGFGGNAA